MPADTSPPPDARYVPTPTTRPGLVAAAYVVLRRDDEVLLQLRQGTGYRDGFWALVAGHLEAGESIVDAAVREAAEEAGVVVDPADLRPLTTIHRFEVGGPPVEQRCDVFFEATRWRGEPARLESDTAERIGWFSLDRLPEPVVPHELVVLEHLRDGTPVPAVLTVRT